MLLRVTLKSIKSFFMCLSMLRFGWLEGEAYRKLDIHARRLDKRNRRGIASCRLIVFSFAPGEI